MGSSHWSDGNKIPQSGRGKLSEDVDNEAQS